MALQRSFESLDNMSGIGMAIQKWSIYKHDLEGNLCKSKFNVWSDLQCGGMSEKGTDVVGKFCILKVFI